MRSFLYHIVGRSDWRKTSPGDGKKKPALPLDADSLADFAITTIEGAFVLARALDDPKVFADQVAHYRIYQETLFKE